MQLTNWYHSLGGYSFDNFIAGLVDQYSVGIIRCSHYSSAGNVIVKVYVPFDDFIFMWLPVE